MTISPPSKVNTGLPLEPEVLASGVDSLNLALGIEWTRPEFFVLLDMFKEQAQAIGRPVPFFIDIPETDEQLVFNVHPNGTKGYNWLISGTHYSVKFGKAVKPNSRPNAMVEIRSETLWQLGIHKAIDLIVLVLLKFHAKILSIKPSRIDLCMDFRMPSYHWELDLFDKRVSRARNLAHYTKNNALTGVHIGKGKLSGRLYDKALEIKTISQKTWMYDVWGIEEVPENERVIRIEFQLLRETLKDLGIDTIDDCLGTLDNIWAYCTQKWLKFQTNPGKHHTQRKTLPWWITVQNSFMGVSEPVPAVRAKAIRATQHQLAVQVIGLITALAATDDEFGNAPLFEEVSQEGLVKVFRKALRIGGKNSDELKEAVNRKRAKNHRGKIKNQVANYERLKHGLPVDMLTLMMEEDLTWELYDMGRVR